MLNENLLYVLLNSDRFTLKISDHYLISNVESVLEEENYLEI